MSDIRLYWSDNPHRAHHYQAMDLFQKGLSAHGVEAQILPASRYAPSKLAVVWGHNLPHIHENQRKTGMDYIVLEQGYFGDRSAFMSIGANGLNGRADFHSHMSPKDRWDKHGVEVKPWRTGGDYILIMGQCPGDAAVRDVDFLLWASIVANQARSQSDMPVKYRPHPLSLQRTVDGAELLTGTLEDALAGAAAVVTYNSNSGVDSILAGIPTVAYDLGSMAHKVSSRRIEDPLITPDRTQWCRNLGYCQWQHNEVTSGAAWKHIRKSVRT